ncbi:GtrA family protein [Aquibium sp. LZ166]|uniref:GtrA family protein n=1 Tax=Aquibium pacificus TaxID=3153579 RepID=A0ABV3STY8_9HYPH
MDTLRDQRELEAIWNSNKAHGRLGSAVSDPRPGHGNALVRSIEGMSASILPKRLHRLVRFGISGLLATGLYFVLVNVAVLTFGTDPAWASVYAYLLSLLFSYAMQSRFTFGVKGDSPSQVLRFGLTSVVGLSVSYWIIVLNGALELPFVVGALGVCILIPVCNFLVFKHWVFARAKVADSATTVESERV